MHDACNLRCAAQKARDKDTKIPIVNLSGTPACSDAQGSSRQEKNRLTRILRQSIHGVFDPNVKVPGGRIRDAVLLTPAAKHAHLEDMSFAEPSYGLRDHTYEADCKLEKREAGAKVGALATEGNARSMNSQHLDLMNIVMVMQHACN